MATLAHISLIHLPHLLSFTFLFFILYKCRKKILDFYYIVFPIAVTGYLSPTVPMLRGTLLLGRMKYLLKEDGPLHNLSAAVNLAEIKGKNACYFWAGPQPVFVILSPEKIKTYLKNLNLPVCRHKAFKAINTILGTNIFSSTVEQWQPRRNASAIVFSGKVIQEEYSNIIDELIKHYLMLLKKPQNNLSQWSNELMLDITLATIFGVPLNKLDCIGEEKKQLNYLLFELFNFRKIIVFDMPKLIASVAFRHDYINPGKMKTRFYRVLDSLINKVPEINNKPCLFMQYFGQSVGQDNVFGDMLAMLFSGPDSSVSTVLSILRLLDADQHVANQLVKEIKQHAAEPGYINREKTLLARVIKEALRLYPPFIFLTRGVSETMSFQDAKLPTGTLLFFPILQLQRLERVWGADALAFNPERWLDTTPEQLSHYFPFGYGAQNCIAKGFALNIIKKLISAMVMTMGLPTIKGPAVSIETRETNSDVTIQYGGTLKPKQTLFGSFNRR